MAQEFTINSSTIESKINQLLPSQGGFGAGVDFTASTMVIPIVDLTESAEGSSLREDLQTSLSLGSITAFNIRNATTTMINNTGYWRVFGALSTYRTTATSTLNINLTDGITSKIILDGGVAPAYTSVGFSPVIPFDFTVFLEAGNSLVGVSGSVDFAIIGNTRQIATIDGTLVNP